jgi:uncharacterized protein
VVSTALLAQTFLIVLLSAALRGLTGFGFALASVPLLGLVMEPTRAVPLSLTIVAIGGAFGVRKAIPLCDWTTLRGLGTGALIGTPVGALVLELISPDLARIAIAIFIIAALFSLQRVRAPKASGGGPASRVGHGLLAGLFNGLAAMPGPPIVAYYMGTGFSRETIRACLLVIFQFTAWIGSAGAIAMGLVGVDTLLLAGCALPAFWIGNRLGAWLFTLGSETAYRRIALACLAAMALGSAVPAFRALARSGVFAAVLDG